MTKEKANPKIGANRKSRHAPNNGNGRPKGAVNKTTALLKEATLMAAELAGQKATGVKQGEGLVEYLKIQALENPAPFMSLLGKILPLQVTGENGGAIEMVSRIAIETIPVGDNENG